jgi:hypothetical protein|tara:strand:+ start:649 stop:1080 length:432 start_codon:yes stop_codon:yes gene_type:complete
MKLFLFLIFLVVILLYKPSTIEGFKPNEYQFLNCNGNYVKEKNIILGPLKGFYSSIIKLTEEKNNPRYYKSPKCITSKRIKNNYFNNNKVIDHSKNNWTPPLDPFDKYTNPENNDSILYPENFLEDMIHQHERINQKEILNRI